MYILSENRGLNSRAYLYPRCHLSLNGSDDINRAWENIKENIKVSAKESLKSVGREAA
jgi:hypothetical protein